MRKLELLHFRLTFSLTLIQFLDSIGKIINRKAVVCTFAVPQNHHLHIKQPPPSSQFNLHIIPQKVHQCQIEVLIPMQDLQRVSCWDAEVGAPEIYKALSTTRGQVRGKTDAEIIRVLYLDIVITINYQRDEGCSYISMFYFLDLRDSLR